MTGDMSDTKNLQEEINAEIKRLVESGTPEVVAGIKAASNVYKRRNSGARQSTDAELKAAMATSCLEP
jgi:hypothetical protein